MDALTPPVSVMKDAPAGAFKKSVPTWEQFDNAAREFEAVFFAQMLKPMFAGLKTDGPFGGGKGEDFMRDLLIQEYGKAMVRKDGFGLSPVIRDQMIQLQEIASSQKVER
ncbi:MAG: rod-binding protein [Alphaproteobacteria bacterium]|nr:rod-binding protein [Alphaproteobacteria bacterium]